MREFMSERLKALSEKAAKEGFDKTEEYVLRAEVSDVIKKVKSSLDNAFILEDVRFVPIKLPTESKRKR